MFERDDSICLVDLPIELGGVLDKNFNSRPNVVGIYIPPHVKQLLGWEPDVELELYIEKGSLSIFPKEPEVIFDDMIDAE